MTQSSESICPAATTALQCGVAIAINVVFLLRSIWCRSHCQYLRCVLTGDCLLETGTMWIAMEWDALKQSRLLQNSMCFFGDGEGDGDEVE